MWTCRGCEAQNEDSCEFCVICGFPKEPVHHSQNHQKTTVETNSNPNDQRQSYEPVSPQQSSRPSDDPHDTKAEAERRVPALLLRIHKIIMYFLIIPLGLAMMIEGLLSYMDFEISLYRVALLYLLGVCALAYLVYKQSGHSAQNQTKKSRR